MQAIRYISSLELKRALSLSKTSSSDKALKLEMDTFVYAPQRYDITLNYVTLLCIACILGMSR